MTTVASATTPGISGVQNSPKNALATAMVVLTILMGLALGAKFLVAQDIWVDETTQLSGLTLNPLQMLPWLCGQDAQRFGVPGDRMPPLSYWAGWGWSHVFGLTETSLRVMGLAATVAASWILFLAARRVWGPWAGVLACAAFLLNPNTLLISVEIRAYPLFLLTTVGTLYFLIRVLEPAESGLWGVWLGLSVCLIAGIYTHFYGVLVAAAVFCALAAAVIGERKLLRPLLTSAVIVGVASAGVIPFVLAAMRMGGGTTAEDFGGGSFAKFIYRSFIGHPALAVSKPVMLVGMVGFGLMLVAALLPKPRGRRISRALIVMICAGCLAAVAAKAVVGKFDAFAPSYNLWRVPVLCLIAASVVTLSWRSLRWMGIAAVACILLAGAWACLTAVNHAAVFRHTPHREVAKLVREVGSRTVFYDGASGWGGAYFPLLFSQAHQLRHLLIQQGATGEKSISELPSLTPVLDNASLPEQIIVLAAEYQSSGDTTAMCRGLAPHVAISEHAKAVLESLGFERVREGVLNAQDAVAFAVYGRRKEPAH